MTEPTWIDLEIAMALHARQIIEHGGADGIRDLGMLESALDRPKNKWYYDESATVHDLAAAYAYGIAMNHPFVDGNKRTAFLAMDVFLKAHGFDLTASLADRYTTFLRLAAGELSEEELAAWLRDNSAPRPDAPNPSA